MYLSVTQEDRLRTIVLGFEIPFRSYVSETVLSSYMDKTSFKAALSDKVSKLSAIDSKAKIDNTRRMNGNAEKIYDIMKECYDAYCAGGVTKEIDVLYVSDLIWSIKIFPDLFSDLYALFPDEEALSESLLKYYFVRNKLSHPACIKLESSFQNMVLSFITDVCNYLGSINEKYFWVKSQGDIEQEVLALQTLDVTIPVPIHNIYDMPFPDAQMVCRDTEIDDIKRFIYGIKGALRKKASYCVTGYGGVGKTALVLESIKSIIKDLQDGTTINNYKPKFILFFSAKEEKLDISVTSGAIQKRPVKKQFGTLDELQKGIFTALSIESFEGYSHTGIIVVDNFESLALDQQNKIRDFIQFMTPPGIQYIITSRNEEKFDETKLIGGFEKESGCTFVNEYISENNLNVSLDKDETNILLDLSRGNTLVLVLSLRRLSNNLITIEGLSADYSRVATTKKVAEELRTLPANGYEIIGEFMFKNTFLEIENIFAADSEVIYSVLKIFAVCSQDGVDIYTISMLLKLDYVSLQPIISLLCRYLIIETDGDGYTLNRFAEKYIIQRFMPDTETYLTISAEIESSVREIRRELAKLNNDIQTNPKLKNIIKDWSVTVTGDQIAAAKIYHQYQSVDSACRKDSRYYLESTLNDALDITADIERTTLHPYVKYQKARILQVVDDANILKEKHTEEIFEAYREAIWIIKSNPLYTKIRSTRSYASVLWLFGSRLYDEDVESEEALRYLEESANCFNQLNDKSKQYYQCLTRLGFSLLMQYRKDPKTKLSYLRKSRDVSNKLFAERGNYSADSTTKYHATQLRNEIRKHGQY